MSVQTRTPRLMPDPAQYPWFCPKPSLRILFYTDDPRISLDPDVTAYENQFGVRILHDLLVGTAHAQDLVDVDITLLDRHQPSDGATRLTPETLAAFDEVWFFTARWEPNTADNLHRELHDDEVGALTAWMQAGGVLITGDHANRFRPGDVLAPPDAITTARPFRPGEGPRLPELLGLGRSVGHRVPRAGLLRRWEGGPPQYAEPWEKNVNTQILAPPQVFDIDDLVYQEDEWPQRLILTTYSTENTGLPMGPASTTTAGRRVHRLFCGRTGPIDLFPDHMHEGQVLVPSTLETDVWPSGPNGEQPTPEVVARGTDQEAGTIHDLVVAYDGSVAGVGRIVADSTWHHYFNVNLKGFAPCGSVLTQLTQYYLNLAIWLAPAEKRREIARWLLWNVIQDPNVQMSLGNAPRVLGRVATGVTQRRSGSCMVRDLLTQQAASNPPPSATEPPLELLVGNVIDTYVRAMARVDRSDDQNVESRDTQALLAEARKAAFEQFRTELTDALEALPEPPAPTDRLPRPGLLTAPPHGWRIKSVLGRPTPRPWTVVPRSVALQPAQ